MKAILYYLDTKNIVEIITNVTDYTNDSIFGDTSFIGLSPNCSFLLLDDSIAITDIPTIQPNDFKPQNDAIESAFTSAWNNADPILQHKYATVFPAVVNYIRLRNYAEILRLANSPYLPADESVLVQPLLAILPIVATPTVSKTVTSANAIKINTSMSSNSVKINN